MILELVVIIEGIIIGYLAIKMTMMEGDIEILRSHFWKQQDSIFYTKTRIADLYNKIGEKYEEEVMVWQKQRRRQNKE